MIITPVGNPIHGDFFSVSGSDIVGDASFEFTTAVGTVNVTPSFIRPHLALIARLPSSLPLGPATLQLTSPSVPTSNSVGVTVLSGSPQAVRILGAGEAKTHP